MNTSTSTYTKTDIRKVFANFEGDLLMLAIRTQAMDRRKVSSYVKDIILMAKEKCLRYVHVQLRDVYGKRIKVHKYSIQENLISTSQSPGANRWPCLPNSKLIVLIDLSDYSKYKTLKESGQFENSWKPSSLSTDYSGMQEENSRFYSSNGYGLQRNTFVNL